MTETTESHTGTPGALRTRRWRFPSTPLAVRSMRLELRPFLAASGLREAEVDDLVLAACEAASNGVEHARQPVQPYFDVDAEVDGPRGRVVVRDYGRWTVGRAAPTDRGRGRGLHMMTTLAAVSLTSGPDGTTVTLSSLI